ncbi:glycosyltransferase family A protein [Pseudomonas sp.]|uniref:glycosyltransferase family 2 protein n=1 Tax=Pseudomonas sp. TaxID=306 RepID=UPI0025839D10|nr:glycosyltransferase family A protein [Pseudomonas sp.]
MKAGAVKASVIIPTKNGGRLFGEVLQAIVSQETEWPFEVLVIDSGSGDGTLAIARQTEGVRVLSVEPGEFQHGRTRNFAIENAQGEFIAMVTQDALPASPQWLQALVEVMETDSRIAGVFGRHIAYPEASLFTRNELIAHFNGFCDCPVVSLDDPYRYAIDTGYRQYLYFFSDNNALLRRSVWEAIPYPEVDFSEDQGWARLVIEAGYKKAYSHKAAVFHSHNYGLWERFQRSFDESLALTQMFGYPPSPSRVVIRNWVGLTLRDLKTYWVQRATSGFRGIVDLIRMPIDNCMRIGGAWVGSRQGFNSEKLIAFCSRDKKLKRARR